MYVCMYVCMCVCVYVCMYVCMYVKGLRTPTGIAVAPAPEVVRFAGNITAIRSPPGHRRLRKVRSRARASLRKGDVPPLRGLSALYVHHATSVEQRRRLRSLMGGHRGGRGTSREDDRKWQLWSGAYSPPWHKQQQERLTFPTYSGVAADKDVSKPMTPGPSRGQSDGYQTQDLQSAVNMTRKAEDSRGSGSQTAHRLCHCSRAMGSVRAEVKGQLLEGEEALLSGSDPDRERCLGGRRAPGSVSAGCPRPGPWDWAADHTDPGSRKSRGVRGVAICQLGLRGRRCGSYAESNGLSQERAGHYSAEAQLEDAHDTGGPCWNTRPFDCRIRPLPGNGTRAGCYSHQCCARGAYRLCGAAGPQPPGAQAPWTTRQGGLTGANQRGAASGEHQGGHQDQGIYSAPACDLGVQAPGPQTKGDGEDAGASALRGWQCASNQQDLSASDAAWLGPSGHGHIRGRRPGQRYIDACELRRSGVTPAAHILSRAQARLLDGCCRLVGPRVRKSIGETSSTQAPVGQGTASKWVEHVYLRQDGFQYALCEHEVVPSRRLYSFIGCTGTVLRTGCRPPGPAFLAVVFLGRRFNFPWVLGLFWPALTASSAGSCLLPSKGGREPPPLCSTFMAPSVTSFSTERVPNNCIGGSGTVTALVLCPSRVPEVLSSGGGVPNSDIGGSGVVTHFTDGLPQRWHLPLFLLLSGAGAPFSLLHSVGLGVPVTMFSSRERRQHWACVVLGSPLPCPLFQTEHFGSAPWNQPVTTPYGRAPKRCIGGSGTSTGLWVTANFAAFAEVGVFLTRISAQANHAPLVLLPGHSQRRLGSSLSTCLRPELLNTSCTADHSYALGSLAEELLCPFFRHLALVLLFSLLGLMMRPLKAHDTPLGGLVLLPTKGIPLGLLRPAALWSVTHNAVATQTATQPLPRGRRTCRPIQGAMPPHPGLFSLLRMWVWYYLFPCMPLQVWAAPPSLREDLGANGRHDDSLPEHLGSTASLGAQTTLQDELHFSMLQQSMHHDLTRPLENADALPVPPLHDVPEAGQQTASPLRGVCYAIAPQYQAEVLWLTLSLPLDLAAFNHAVREALRSLRLPFCYIIAPTVPQLGPDFASVVLAPKWLPQVGRQLIVHDFRPLGGPVYASITSDNVTHQDCEREAVSLGYRQTSIYVQGHSRAIEVGDSFLASLGGVIQHRPRGQPAEWCSTLHARFDRPRRWVPHPMLPTPRNDRPVLALYHDRCTLYSASRHPGVPTLRFLADLVDRTPDRALFVSPPGSALTDVDVQGTSCRDALAIFPLTPARDREGIIVFLDPRQADGQVTHVYLASNLTDPHFLVRFLGLKPPPCYRVAILPRPGRNGTMHLSEGDIITFGFKEDHPWSTDEEDSSSNEQPEESQSQHTSDAEVELDAPLDDSVLPRGPPPPMPVNPEPPPVQGSERSRSRTPPNRVPARTADPAAGSSSALARSALGLTLGLAQLDPAEGIIPPYHEVAALSFGTQISPWHISVAILVCLGLLFLCGRLAAITHKVLQEPKGRTPDERRDLRRLRGVTRRFGGRWITDPPLRLPGLLPPQSEDESDSDSTAAAQDLRVPCAILRPRYTAETFDVIIQIPATPGELSEALQTLRHPETVADFPQLVPTLPQPRVGVATFVAYPDWPVTDVLICLDTTAIDGRLFAAKVPPCVCGRDLVQFAGLLPNLEYVVLYNVDQEPIADRPVRLFPGALVTFLHPTCPWPAQFDLGELLRSRLAWGPEVSLPAVGHQNAYCLVHGGTANLCTDCGQHPARYRDYIVDATGADPHRMRLFVANPVPADVALCGVWCATTLAVCHPPALHPQLAWHGALLDCRPLLESWQEIIVPGGYVPQRQLFGSLAAYVPAGWCLRLDHREAAPGVVWLAPGQVVTATLVRDERPGTQEAPNVAPADPNVSAAGVTPQPGTGSDTSSRLPGTAFPLPDFEGSDRLHEDPGPGDVPEGATRATNDHVLITFAICVPEFLPETLTVRVPIPCDLTYALQRMSSGREAARRQWFPRLIAAYPQPDAEIGFVLAMPVWDTTGIFVLVEDRRADGRIFATTAPPMPNRRLLLDLVGAPEGSDACVYVRDLPWPLVDEVTIQLDHGDLVSIQPTGHDLTIVTTLSDRLQDPNSWAPRVTPTPREEEQLWLLSDEWPRRLPYARGGAASLRADIAGVLHTPEAALRIRPSRPGIFDLCVRGYPISAVVIATAIDIRLVEHGTGLFPYVLDLRPILAGIEWGANPEGYLSLHSLVRRFAPRCPPGFRVTCHGGQPEPPPLQHFLRFNPGDTFTVFFEPVPIGSWAARPLPPSGRRLDDEWDPPAEGAAPDSHTQGPVALPTQLLQSAATAMPLETLPLTARLPSISGLVDGLAELGFGGLPFAFASAPFCDLMRRYNSLQRVHLTGSTLPRRHGLIEKSRGRLLLNLTPISVGPSLTPLCSQPPTAMRLPLAPENVRDQFRPRVGRRACPLLCKQPLRASPQSHRTSNQPIPPLTAPSTSRRFWRSASNSPPGHTLLRPHFWTHSSSTLGMLQMLQPLLVARSARPPYGLQSISLPNGLLI